MRCPTVTNHQQATGHDHGFRRGVSPWRSHPADHASSPRACPRHARERVGACAVRRRADGQDPQHMLGFRPTRHDVERMTNADANARPAFQLEPRQRTSRPSSVVATLAPTRPYRTWCTTPGHRWRYPESPPRTHAAQDIDAPTTRGRNSEGRSAVRSPSTRWPLPVLVEPSDALDRPFSVASCDLDTAIVHRHAPQPGPFAFGHEFVAEVVETGPDVTTVEPGDQPIVPFQIACGFCDQCRAGLSASCRAVPLMAMFGLAPLTNRDPCRALSDLVRVPYADATLVAIPAGWTRRPPATSERRSSPSNCLQGPGEEAEWRWSTTPGPRSRSPVQVGTSSRSVPRGP